MKRWIALAVCAAFSATAVAESTDEAAIKLRLDQVAQSYTANECVYGNGACR